MDPDEATERLWPARQQGDFCPAWLPGALSLNEALGVQLRLLERELAAGRELAGWKVGLTSPRARTALGADVRPFGYILADRVLASGADVEAAAIHRPSIEAELCFTVGRQIDGADVTRADARAAMSHISAGFEINERRPSSARPDLTAMATDCMSNWGIVAGASVEVEAAGDINTVDCRMERDGELVYEGISRDELDDHFESLRALVLGLAPHGRGLLPGQRVITGAFVRVDAAAGQRWRATYSGIGTVEVSFT
jgi:2-oxo-hept-3-ene-1,7-dioate hydratase